MTVTPISTAPAVRRLAAFVALLIAVALLPLATANAQDERVVIDLDLLDNGVSDPVQASVLFSRQTFTSADEALIATSFDGADALASGSLQSGVGDAAATDAEGTDVTGRPLLFVDPTAGPEQALLDELTRLGVSTLILLGGEGALPPEVVTAFNEAGFTDVQRQGGTTRIGTAAIIAEYVLANSETTTAYLSRAFGTGEDRDTAYADATALGGWAASTGNPILLTDTNTLSLETSLLLQQGDIERVEIIGGTAAVSAEVEQEVVDMGLEVARVEGATRDQTATAIADARGAGDADNAPRVILAEGFAPGFFVDAFAAAAHSGLYDAPVLLSNGDDLSPATEDYLATATFAIAESGLVGLCGTDVPDGPCADLAGTLGASVSNVTLDTTAEPTPTPTPTEEGPAEIVGDLQVDPREDSTVQVSIGQDRPAGEHDDAVTYTATGLDPEAFYRITLVVEDNITIEGEAATFVDADDSTPDDEENDGLGNGTADAGASEEIALITSVNGEAIEPAKTTPATDDDPAAPTAHAPSDDGELTFVVDAVEDSEGGTVHPVVYVNGGESTFLEVDADGAPTESYGVGGAFIASAVIGDLDVSGHAPATVTVDVISGTDGDEADERTYVVAGLDDATAYRISLFLDSNITFNDDQSEATFALSTDEEDQPDGTAEQGDTASVATIISVNGEPYEAAETDDGTTAPASDDDPAAPTGIFPVDGTITFVVDGTDSTLNEGNTGGTIRPVVFVNGGDSTQLEVDADGAPTEVYGVGGAFTTTFIP